MTMVTTIYLFDNAFKDLSGEMQKWKIKIMCKNGLQKKGKD